jgi:hypothetical protein
VLGADALKIPSLWILVQVPRIVFRKGYELGLWFEASRLRNGLRYARLSTLHVNGLFTKAVFAKTMNTNRVKYFLALFVHLALSTVCIESS